MTETNAPTASPLDPPHHVLRAAPEEVVALLLDGLLAALVRCRDELTRGAAADVEPVLGGAREAVATLRGALDLGAGGQVARDLERLYDCCAERLTAALRTPGAPTSAAAVAEAHQLLAELRRGWRATTPPAALRR